MRSSSGINGRQTSTNNNEDGNEEDDENDSDSLVDPKMKQRPADNVELSSTGSEGRKGSGSGGGYSADCSSSDASSDDAAKGSVPEKEMKRLKVSGENKDNKPKEKDPKTSNGRKDTSSGVRLNPTLDLQQDVGDQIDETKIEDEVAGLSGGKDAALPQWNGVRIQHPMDPRIDLSTVARIRTSSLSTYPHNAHLQSIENLSGEVPGMGVTQVAPSIDQYMKLMEVVRPFFHAHGMSHLQPSPAEHPDHRLSRSEVERPDDSPKTSVATVELLRDSQAPKQADTAGNRLNARKPINGSNESDSSSMVVLARVKRKHLKNSLADDPAIEGSNDSSRGGSNVSSTSSSDKRVRIQHPEFRDREESKYEEDPPRIENGSNGNGANIEREIPDEDRVERHESASASSSESGNNVEAPPNAPIGFGVPAVVSEYSSSRVGSSGASNTNQMSTSGSGSAGNTGSGTGSGSNQGGSSGSGNDQGGISSVGNGSSASGNDVKGSSEEMMDNSAENNSGEGNSDATNSNNETKSNIAVNGVVEASHSTAHRHHHSINDPIQRDPENPAQSNTASSNIKSNAVRERKLQDKKRKRQIMRREYEEKVQQEMESSEGSRECEESAIKPGRPVTLDKVLSFTKVPRIVVSATPPFLVVHTNAAYCRLSGIDSHAVVGKPISILLSIPDLQTLAEVTQNHQRQQETTEEAPGLESAIHRSLQNDDSNQDSNDNLFQTESRERYGLTAAEAAGRARAAASQADSVERIIATSGLGRWSIINLNAKPLLDQNLAIVKPSEIHKPRSREGDSNGSSIASNCEGSYRDIVCSMGVSPVVSSPEAFTVVADKDQESHHHKSKRRKHHPNDSPSPHHHQPRRNFLHREISIHRKRHIITHYVIQVEPLEGGSRKLSSLESQSSISTTVEAQMLGVTKSELRLQRDRAMAGGAGAQIPANEHEQRESDDDFIDSESSNPHEAVTAVG